MNIKIDGQEYDLDKLSDESKAQIASIQAVDVKLAELQRDTAIVMTARNMYIQALKNTLNAIPENNSAKPTKAKAK